MALHNLTASSAGAQALPALLGPSSSQAGLGQGSVWAFLTVKSLASTAQPHVPNPCTNTTTHIYLIFLLLPRSENIAEKAHFPLSRVPSQSLLTELLCDSFSGYLHFLHRDIPWKRRLSLIGVPMTAEGALISYFPLQTQGEEEMLT